MSSHPIRFFHAGEVTQIASVSPTRTVLNWLREDAHCTGTKEGCNEGDCGACMVVLGRLDATAPQGLALRAVNACLQWLPSLHGQALFTVEDLKTLAGGSLHPVQQALVNCHGSQCGFCTPGFVMSMWSCHEQPRNDGQVPSRQALADALAGNLCRCTGYRPILDAAQQLFEVPPSPWDRGPVVRALQSIRDETPAQWQHQHPQGRFFTPRSLNELARLRQAHPQALLLSGGTDAGLWVNKQFKHLPEVIYLREVPELQQTHRLTVVQDGQQVTELHIGAAVSLEDAWRALAQAVPALTELWLRFASPSIRHAGTLVGNLANGSPIGDSAPALLALDSRLLLRRGEQQRSLPLNEFYLGYMKNALQEGEFVEAVCVPLPQPGQSIQAYKVSKRFDSDISALCAGLCLTLDGTVVKDVRLAFGGLAAVVRRAPLAEAAMKGQPWSRTTLAAAQAALAQDFQPLSDLRASAVYRLRVAQNLLERFWLETGSGTPPAPQPISVWPQRQDEGRP